MEVVVAGAVAEAVEVVAEGAAEVVVEGVELELLVPLAVEVGEAQWVRS